MNNRSFSWWMGFLCFRAGKKPKVLKKVFRFFRF